MTEIGTCAHWVRGTGYAQASLYAACPWCELETLRNDLTAARMERDALGALLADHNAGCKMDCEARKNCEPYTRRGRKCPDCPQHYVIELPSDPHPTGDGSEKV